MTADQLRETRRGEFESTVDNADSTRKRRLQAIFAAAESHGVHQAVAVAAYERTQDEINKARHAWRDARDEAVAARERAVMAQRELARAMQVEEKVRLLARNLLQRENEEAARQE